VKRNSVPDDFAAFGRNTLVLKECISGIGTRASRRNRVIIEYGRESKHGRARMVLRGSNRMQIVAELRNNLQGDKHKRKAIVPRRFIDILLKRSPGLRRVGNAPNHFKEL